MSMFKVIEVLSDSSLGWEDAAKRAIEKATNTLHDEKSINIKDTVQWWKVERLSAIG